MKKLTKQEIEELLSHKSYEINWDAKCDLCGHIFIPILTFPLLEEKDDCPNCGHHVYFERDF